MYKLDLSEKTYKADFGEKFGVFTIRALGAGEELELNMMARELEKKAEELEALGDKKDEDFTDEDKKKMSEASDLALKNRTRTIEILKGVFTSETEGAVDKLFNTLDIVTIRGAYDEVTRNNG